ncbi:Organic hydroperoxide resistance protein [Neorhizobium galegae bv. orientalis]|nr:Organic hydroperoxide resistance protein [Neorhizobium galegae bv. orientalis]
MEPIYTARVSASGGRHGMIKSDDGILDLALAMPASLGGKGGATNPEQLFAGGYAACFENALFRAARESRHHIPDGDITVVGEVGLSKTPSDTFALSVTLHITVVGVEIDVINELVDRADAICPYSNAIRGNVPVTKITQSGKQ